MNCSFLTNGNGAGRCLVFLYLRVKAELEEPYRAQEAGSIPNLHPGFVSLGGWRGWMKSGFASLGGMSGLCAAAGSVWLCKRWGRDRVKPGPWVAAT